MRIIILFLLIFSTSSTILSGQTDNLGLIFPISAQECQQLLENDVANLDFLINRQVTDTIVAYFDYNKLSLGHYIVVKAQKEQISWNIISRNKHHLFLHDDNKKLNVSITDRNGKVVNKALVRFEKKKMRFQKKSNSFSSKRLNDGLLIAYLPSDTLFYNIDSYEDKSIVYRRLVYFSRSKVGHVVSAPVRWLFRGARYIKGGIKYKQWRIRRWPFQRLYQRIVNSNREIKGYIASSQPVYRIGDTLKLSAYVNNQNGRPVNHPLRLTIAQKNRYVDKQISPISPGRFTFDWILGDSLLLDQLCHIQLIEYRKKRSSSSLRYQFKIEDYQLEEYRFDLLTKNPEFEANEPAEFEVKANDTNNLPVPATSVSGYILLERTTNIYGDSMLIPDTLWRFQEEMGNRTILSLLPPDSIWPKANIYASLHINFIGPSGESSKHSTSFSINRPTWTPLLLLKNDSIYPLITGTKDSISRQGQLFVYGPNNLIEERALRPNVAIPFNPIARRYEWIVDQKKAYLYLNKENSLVQFDYTWVNDSLMLRWSNPRRLSLQWSLKTSNGTIESSQSNDAFIYLPLPKKQGKRQLWLHYSYYWFNNQHQYKEDLKALNDQLQLSIETPEKIYPGQTENITISVQDAKGKPAKNVALTAAAYNAQFQESPPYKASNIRFKGRRQPFTRQRYGLELASKTNQVALTKVWYEKLELEHSLYYRIRFPSQDGLYEYRALESTDSLASVTAQIAPWLVQNGKALPIHLFYLDNRLVYYHRAWQSTRYSIVSEPGYHQLTMRTTHGEIKIDSVLLKAGHTLDMSIDLNQYDAEQITYSPKKNHLSQQEIDILERRLFYMRPINTNEPHFLYQNPKHIFQQNHRQNSSFAWGLLRQNGQPTYWLKPGVDTIDFKFEPYFSYQLTKNRDRLYHHRPLSTSKVLSESLPHPVVQQEAVFLSDITLAPVKWHYKFSKFPSESAKNRGHLQLFYPNISRFAEALIVSKNDEIQYLLHPGQLNITLPEGDYTLSWVMRDSSLLEKQVSILAHHQLSYKIEQESLSKKQIPTPFIDFLNGHKTNRSRSNPQISNYSHKNNSYYENGRLISGIIRDEDGEVLIGASVLLSGTTMGTVTDLDGRYELWVPYGDAKLSVNYTGYGTKLIDVEMENYFSISLSNHGMLLNEVVVVGYGVMRKESISSSVSIRGSREKSSSYYIDGLPTRNINALAGRVSGVMVSVDSPAVGTSDEDIDLAFDEIIAPLDSIRDHFSDYAYWQPTLTTNTDGKVTFPVTFPDDITNWRHFALGMDGKNRLGLAQSYTQSYLPLQAQLYTPRFLVEGDNATVKGILTNRSGQPLEVNTYLQSKDGLRENRTSLLELSAKEIFELESVPIGIDSLEYTYGLQAGDYRDGEQRPIPVFRKGSERTVGGYLVLNQDSTYQVKVDPTLGPVDIRVGANGLPQLMKEINWLRNYRYGCNEQTASRLIALLAIKSIQPPDSFDVKLEKAINGMIHRLDKTRQPNGSWGWWKSSEKPSQWVTQHVLLAFEKAAKMGYNIPDVNQAERYLLSLLPELGQRRRLDALLFFAERGQVLDYPNYLLEYDTLQRSLQWEIPYRRIQQLENLPYQLDSLSKYAQHTLTGARYWGTQQHWFYRPSRQVVGLTLKAYQLYRDAGMADTLSSIQQYFMEDDPFYPQGASKDHWAMNTYEASQMTSTLLPDLLGENQILDSINVTISQANQVQKTLKHFPSQQSLLPFSNQPIGIKKSGDGPAFVSYHQNYWDTDPPIESNGFTITTDFIEAGKKVSTFQIGKPIKLSINVTAKADTDYVLVEVPVPAGCSYGKKIFRESRRETHREYQRDRVAIFVEHLPKGEHHFTVNLEPRFTGTYHVNPARVEMMYVPSFNGSTEMKVIDIK